MRSLSRTGAAAPTPIDVAIRSNSAPMLISALDPMLNTSPCPPSSSAIAISPRHVSSTNVKSRVVVRSPSRTSRIPAASCEMMVGITARADCRGPYVLNGRATTSGRSNE